MSANDNETLAGMMATVVEYHAAAAYVEACVRGGRRPEADAASLKRYEAAAGRLRSIAGPEAGANSVMAAVVRRIVAKERERVLRSAYLTLSGGTSSSRPEYVHTDMKLRLAALEGICEIGPDVIREYDAVATRQDRPARGEVLGGPGFAALDRAPAVQPR